ncbi:beta/gamma crystallin-related protein [Sphingopyxis sp. KK2]|uniref:beta/gamma crystallin-related protein n=1 Tax=Sphingopyxis sp. KK2 TaxID=1855727 RepID=UPI00097E7494|nr:beta/gamma crystallin-related protein [Sphingopyxis sp. KK2]
MTRFITLAAAALGLALVATPLAAQNNSKTIEGTLTLFEGQKFDGDSYRLEKDEPSLQHDFLVGSIAVFPGETWELCDKPKFKGNCLTVSANETGIGKAMIKSARVVKAK